MRRFQGLDIAIKDSIELGIDTAAIQTSVMDRMAPAIANLQMSPKKPSEELFELDKKLRSAVIHEVVMPLIEDASRLAFPASFVVRESREAASRREALEGRLQTLQTAFQQLDLIEMESGGASKGIQ